MENLKEDWSSWTRSRGEQSPPVDHTHIIKQTQIRNSQWDKLPKLERDLSLLSSTTNNLKEEHWEEELPNNHLQEEDNRIINSDKVINRIDSIQDSLEATRVHNINLTIEWEFDAKE